VRSGATEFYQLGEAASANPSLGSKRERLIRVLDALATVALEAVEYTETDLVEAVQETLFQIYEHAESHAKQAASPYPSAIVWYEVMKRVYIIGAALLERKQYRLAAMFIDQPITWDEYWRPRLWARHALTAYANTFTAPTAPGAELVGNALEDIMREPVFLRPFGDRERALDRLVQFDFLQCIYVTDRTDNAENSYPSFCHYQNRRAEPIVIALVSDKAVREQAIPSMDDRRLAMIIDAVDSLAGRVVPFLSHGWRPRGWSDQRIWRFLEEHLPN
jgi:hypothetical protein